METELDDLHLSQKQWGNRESCPARSWDELVIHRACDGGIRTWRITGFEH